MALPREFWLSQEEAHKNAVAQLAAQRQFGFEISPKWAALAALATVTVATMKPKMGAFAARIRAQRQAAAEAASPFNVPGGVNMPPTHQQPLGPRPGNGAAPPGEADVLRSGTHGVILTGRVPDGGKLDFGPA